MQNLWLEIEPAVVDLIKVTVLGLLAALSVIVPVILNRFVQAAVSYFERKTRISLEQKWQDDLHRALETGALSTLEKVRQGILANDEATKVKDILEYVRASVSDALAGLRPPESVLHDLAVSKIAKAAK